MRGLHLPASLGIARCRMVSMTLEAAVEGRNVNSIFDQFDRWVHVEGPRLPALERNIARYRAFQTLLFLFKAESLKKYLSGLMSSFNQKLSDSNGPIPEHLTKEKWTKIPDWRRSCERLVEMDFISRKTARSVVKYIGYRDKIAHNLSALFGDIGQLRVNREMMRFPMPGEKYRYNYLKLLTDCENEILEAGSRLPIIMMNSDDIYFESVEKFMRQELARLQPRIQKQIDSRKEKFKKLRLEIFENHNSWDWEGEFFPKHPDYQHKNGRLTAKGERACYLLFELGKSDLAVAYLMGLSRKAVKRRRKNWGRGR